MQLIPEMGAGGAEQAVIDVTKGLIAQGAHAFIITKGGARCKELEQLGATCVSLNINSKNPWNLWRNSHKISSIIAQHDIHLIHARSRAPAWSGLWASRHCHIPFLTTYHGIYSEKSWLKKYYNSVMVRGNAVIANSHYTAALIQKRYGALAKQIITIARGIDLSHFHPDEVTKARIKSIRQQWGVTSKDKVILLPGRLTSWKGHQVAIEAYALLPETLKQQYKLIFMGDAQGRLDYVKLLQDRLYQLNLEKQILFAPHSQDMPAAFMASDIVVNCASGKPEAFGRVAVEAQAMGKAMIVSSLGPTKETVLAPPHCDALERTGWHFPENDAAALADAILEAASLSKDAQKALGQRARNHILQHFTTENMVQQTLNSYVSLLSINHPACCASLAVTPS